MDPQTSLPKETQDQGVVDIGAQLGVLWRGKWLVLLCMLIGVMIGGYYAFRLAVPSYRATSVVMLDTKIGQFTNFESVVGQLSGNNEEVQTEVEIIRSHRLLGKVVDFLDLTKDPEFNEDLRDPSVMDKLGDWIRQLTAPAAQPTLTTDDLGGTDAIEKRMIRDAVIEELRDSMRINNIEQTLVFEISVDSETALKAVKIADTLADQYILDQISLKLEETEKATVWLSEKVSEFKSQLESAVSKVSEFNAVTELVSPEALQRQEINLKSLRQRQEDLETSLENERALLEIISKENVTLAEISAFLLETRNSGVDTSYLTLPESEQKTYLENLRRSTSARIVQDTRKLSALQLSAQVLNEKLASQNRDLITLQQLQREAEAVKLLYEYFLGRLKETRAQQGLQLSDSRILSQAVIPNTPFKPKKQVIIALTGILGFMVGAAIVLFIEMRQSGFRTARELQLRFGIPVLGQIPKAPLRKREDFISHLRNNPTSAISEAYRNLRTSVVRFAAGDAPKVILSTSCIPGEGKTSNSVGLALSLQGIGKKTLLVEGDIRRRTLDTYFPEMTNLPGLAAVMSGKATLEEALYYSEETGIYVLGGDQSKDNAADVFSSSKFDHLMEQLRDKFEVIVLDTPPVLVVPDARILFAHADSILMNVKWDQTTEYQVEEAVRIFQADRQKISGFLLSQVNMAKLNGYGQYGVYGNYGNQYYGI